jgi:ubiquinone biosynthesis protein
MRQTVGDFMSNLYWLSEDQMARLLSYLFEVTERFGMETRTELILLQRTMVVV